MSCTSDLGMGIREELGKKYYYAFIMFIIKKVNPRVMIGYSLNNHKRYKEILKEEKMG